MTTLNLSWLSDPETRGGLAIGLVAAGIFLLAVPFTGSGDGLRGPMSDGNSRMANQLSYSSFLRRTRPTQSELSGRRYRNMLLLKADGTFKSFALRLGLFCLVSGLALIGWDWIG